MARKRVDDLPVEKREDAGEAPPEVVEPAPPERVRPAPGMVRVQAKAYFKDGAILGVGGGYPFADVGPGEVIEVRPETYAQLKAARPGNWQVAL